MECSKQRSIRSATTWFCVSNGLVTVSKSKYRTHRAEIKRMASSGVKPKELASLRGSRLDRPDVECPTEAASIFRGSGTGPDVLQAQSFESIPTVQSSFDSTDTISRADELHDDAESKHALSLHDADLVLDVELGSNADDTSRSEAYSETASLQDC